MLAVDSRVRLALLVFIEALENLLALDWVQSLASFTVGNAAHSLLSFASRSQLLA